MNRLPKTIAFSLIIILLAGCFGGPEQPAPQPATIPVVDATPTRRPTPTATTPAIHEQDDVPTVVFAGEAAADRFPQQGALIFHFSDAVDPASAMRPVRTLPAVELDASWENNNRTLIAIPLAPLAAGTPHEISLDPALRTAGGEALSPAEPWTITPVAAPRLLRRSPSGRIFRETRPEIVLSFDQVMDVDSVREALQITPPMPFDLIAEGQDIRLISRNLLAPGTSYDLVLGTGALSDGGAPLAKPVTWQIELPEIIGRVTLPQDQGHERPFSLEFNYPMVTGSLENILSVEPPIAGRTKIGPEGRSIAFTPDDGWQAGVDYTVRLTGDLRLADGQSFPPPPPFSFGNLSPILHVEPQGTAAKALGVIRLTFDRPMDTAATAAALRIEPELPGEIRWEENALVFEPEEKFLGEHITYNVTIDRARSADGIELLAAPFTWSFTTASVDPVVSFGYGANAQVLDSNGRRAVHFATSSNAGGDEVELSLYRLTLPQFIDRYSSGFRGVNGYQKKLISTRDAELVTSWTHVTEPGLQEYLSVQETIVPTDVPPGLYVLNGTADGQLYDQLLLDLTDRVVMLKQVDEQIVTWVTDINGAPLGGTPVEIYARDGERLAGGTADEQGVYRANLGDRPVEPLMVVAGEGNNRSISGLTFEWRNFGGSWWWEPVTSGAPYAAHIYTERPIYRPGHTVNFKAIVREDDDAVLANPPAGTTVTVRLRDARNNVVRTLELTTNAFGTVHGAFDIAEGAMSGTYGLELVAGEAVKRVAFEVQDYRKPEYEIDIGLAREAVVSGERIEAEMAGTYYFGEPVANARVTVRLYNLYQTYDWNTGRESFYWSEIPLPEGLQSQTTDAAGRLSVSREVRFSQDGGFGYEFDYAAGRLVNFPYEEKAIEFTVEDGSGQTVSAVHRFRVYQAAEGLSLEQGGYVQEPGAPNRLVMTIENLTGLPVSGRAIDLTLSRWDPRTYNYDAVYQEERLVTGADGRAVHDLIVEETGYYQLTAEARDEENRPLSVTSWLYVTGQADLWFGSGAGDQLTIRGDRDSYAPGDVARLTVETPVGGPALLVVERGSVRRERLVELTPPLTILELPIEATDAPNVFVSINVWQPQVTTLTEQTYSNLPDSRLLTGQVELSVPVTDKTLSVTITPTREVYGPGEEAGFTVRVTNARGEPVSAELSLALVDEAIFALAEDQSGPIADAFYFRRANDVSTYNGLQPQRYFGGFGGGGGGDGGPGGGPRVDFPDTALWVPVLHTDANGEARVTLTLPDSLTTWRLTAKATTADTQVGEGSNTVLVRKDIVVRPFLPTVLVAGDRLALSAMVQNFGEEPVTLDVSVATGGSDSDEAPLTPAGPAVQTITLRPDESRIVGWDMVSAADAAGRVEITIRAESEGTLRDGVILPLEIRPLAVADVRALTGQFRGETAATIAVDPAALPQSVLKVELSRSIAGTLLEGLEFLTGYPYGCVEQTMSRALPNAVVGRAFAQLGVTNATLAADLPGQINAGVQRLYGFQHVDGGWGWWYDDTSDPYQTAWVLFGLVTTRDAGYEIDETVLERGAAWLAGHLSRLDNRTQAYALYTLAAAGVEPEVNGGTDRRYDDILSEVMVELVEEARSLDAFSQAALALALWERDDREEARSILALLAERAEEGRDGTRFWSGAGEDGSYHSKSMASDLRSTAFALSALSRITPDSDLIPGAVRYLMANRRQQGWGTTNETAFAIIGLTDHLLASSFNDAAAETGYEVHLNGERVAGGSLGRGAPAVSLEIPFADLRPGDNTLVLRQSGTQPLYYAVRQTQFLAREAIDPAGSITVKRKYTDLDGRPLAADAIVRNQLVRVELTVTVDEPLSFAIVEDRLPGGLEALNERLNTTSHVGGLYDAGPERRYDEYGYNYKEIRDGRVSFFITELPSGKRTFTYVARATHSGRFVALPAEAYGMYDLARWGRSASDALEIQEQ